MKTPPYGQTLEILKEIPDCECWNSSTGATATLPKGMFVTVQQAYDAISTTVLASTDRKGENDPRVHVGGLPLSNGYLGYRFIIPNKVLGEAIGQEMPEETPDLIGDIIAYETGEMNPDQEKKFLGGIRESGLASKLQGHYGKKCATL